MFVVCLLGTSVLIEDHPSVVEVATVSNKDEQLCRNDIGKSKRLRRWSRGHQFIVRGGGHIDSWSPLYKYALGFPLYRKQDDQLHVLSKTYIKVGVL